MKFNIEKLLSILPMAILTLALSSNSANATLIAGVDFEGLGGIYDESPDDLILGDGITVSSGTNSSIGLFDGWTLVRTHNTDFGGNGSLRKDGNATAAGGTSGMYPSRLSDKTKGSWSIIIDYNFLLDLERIEFDVRGATGGNGRDVQFNTSLDGTNILFEDLNLTGRNAGSGIFQHVSVDLTDAKYQGLRAQEVSFNFIAPGGGIDLDTIQVFGSVSYVPAPASLALLGFGLAGLCFSKRKKA
jgi:hypothetical protein